MCWISDEIDYCRIREAEERSAARPAAEMCVHDVHFVLAERYADRIYSLSERADELARNSRMTSGMRIVG